MEIHAHVPKVGNTLAHWLLEGVFITASVLLAFGVGQYREHRQDRELSEHVLRSVKAEVEHNLAALEPYEKMHREWADNLLKAASIKGSAPKAETPDDIGFLVFLHTRPKLPENAYSNFPSLRRGAWDAALSTGALKLIDYDLVATLSEIYQRQELLSSTVENRMGASGLSSIAFDPASRMVSVRQLWLTMADVVSIEKTLQDQYREHLSAIRAAADGK